MILDDIDSDTGKLDDMTAALKLQIFPYKSNM